MKLNKNTKVLDTSKMLRRRFPKFSRKKNKRIIKQEPKTDKVNKEETKIIRSPEKEEARIFCLEKRQKSSPAAMFAQLRSNRRYKPGDEGGEAREKTKVICGALEK